MAASDVTALAAALQAPFGARLQLQYRIRYGRRTRATGTDAPHGNRRLDVTDHLLALRLRQHLTLPVRAIAVLPGVDPVTISHATTLATGLLAAARITLPHAPPPENLSRTPAGLLGYAAAAGIPLTIPGNGQQMPEQFKPRRSRTTRDTPEPAN
jgi:hypothetical protein